ncbi:UNVERIFIED_CONTAM: MaoC family dehydratase N-terminal domain-containing protein [Mycobacterium avium subsp. hominissuis]
MIGDGRTGETLVVGARREHTVIPDVTRTQIVQYAGASGDYSPLHTDEPYAVRAGYPGVMAHGMLVMAATERLLAEWVGRQRLVRYRVRFANPVWPGDSLHAVATVVEVRDSERGTYVDFEILTTNHHGVVVLSGSSTARV